MKYTATYLNDLKQIQETIPNLDSLNNASIFVTGAGGMICSAAIDFLLYLNDTRNAHLKIYAAARDYVKIKERFGEKVEREDFFFILYDALEPVNCEVKFDYLIHGASNANPAAYVKQPVETMLANVVGIHNVLEYAKKFQAKRVLYISSSEIYGNKSDSEPYNETDYGFVDILNSRACYPSSKRAAETLCAAYESEYGVESVIIRPGHVFGPTATSGDNRASSQFPRDVLMGNNVIMKSAGAQLRSYCYVMDCVSAMLTVLINGKSGQAYNISNTRSVATIRQIAECFAVNAGKKVEFEISTKEEKAGGNLMDNSSLDGQKLELLGWQGMYDLQSGVEHTLQIMREMK